MTALKLANHARSRDTNECKSPITSAEVEMINAYGPFNHSVWRGRGVTITHEESLTGRVEFLSATVRDAITKQFSTEELARLSIVDVGCYDGWLLESLSDLPFQKMVGIEPRPENIERGQRVREILQIPSRVCYETGEIDTLHDAEQFNIVLCMGVLHHLESVQASLEKLRGICKGMLIVDSLCLPSSHLTAELRRDVEMKDMVYRYKAEVFGVTAQKYEGNYYPGSGVRFSVVNVPTAESIKMHLDVLGFHSIRVLANWDDYRAALTKNKRPINAVCMSALIDPVAAADAGAFETKCAVDYETRMLTYVLPDEVLLPLFSAICVGKLRDETTEHCKDIYSRVKADVFGVEQMPDHGPLSCLDSTRREIVASFVHCPLDKIRLEYAKRCLARGDAVAAVRELQQITCRVNADWRACYRAFYFLWRAFGMLNDAPCADHYREHCLRCNPHFPLKLFESPPEFQVIL